MLFRKGSGDLYIHLENEIAAAILIVDVRNSLPAQGKARAGLGSLRDGVLSIALKGGDVDLRAENGIGYGQGHLAKDVVAIALKDRMGLDHHLQDQITGRAAVAAVVTLTAQCNALAIVDTCGNGDLQLLADADKARAAAVLAGGLDDLALAATAVTGGGALELHTAKALHHAHLAGAVALGAGE